MKYYWNFITTCKVITEFCGTEISFQKMPGRPTRRKTGGFFDAAWALSLVGNKTILFYD